MDRHVGWFYHAALLLVLASCTKGNVVIDGLDSESQDQLPIITVDNVSASEGSSLTFTISLSKVNNDNAVTVDYATTALTATPGTDFIATIGTATILAGSTSTTVSVSASVDGLDEVDETLQLSLSNAANATLASSFGTGTILDSNPAPTIGFASASQTVVENSGTFNVAVSLSALSGKNVSFDVDVSGSSAAATDYAISSVSYSISAGSLTANVGVTIVNDAILEHPETIVLTLTNLTNTSGDAITTHTITINDNEEATVSLSGLPVDPSNDSMLSIVVSGPPQLGWYKYKVGNGADCTSAAGYSGAIAAATPITDDVSSLSGNIVLCVKGVSTSNVVESGYATYQWTRDDLGPSVSVAQNSGQIDPTNSTPVSFDVVFSEPIDPASFTTADISFSGGAAGITWSITSLGDNVNFTLNATTVSVAGTIIPNIAASVIADLAGNLNFASTPAGDDVVTYDDVPPTMPTAITLVDPVSSPSFDNTPTVRVDGVVFPDFIRLYSDSSCSTVVAQGFVNFADNFIELTAWPLSDGNYTFYAKAYDAASNSSACSAVSLAYMLDQSGPTEPGDLANRPIGISLTNSPYYTWSSSVDTGVGLSHYELCIGTGVGWCDVTGWINVGSVEQYYYPGLSLANAGIYYFNVRAFDTLGNVSSTASSGWMEDITPTFLQAAYVKAANVNTSDQFGISMDIDGDVMVVGAHNEDSNQTSISNDGTASSNNTTLSAGAAYVYRRSAGGWVFEAYLKAPNAEANDIFGYSVAVSGDTIVVGAPQEDSSSLGSMIDNSAADAGAVYVFRRVAGTWTFEQYLKASNLGAGDFFGYMVDIDKDTIVVGAPFEDSMNSATPFDNSISMSGAAYVFTRTASVWSQQQFLKAAIPGTNDNFAYSVGVHGDSVVIGSPYEDSSSSAIYSGGSETNNNALSDSGAAYIFTRTGSVWNQQAYLKAPNPGLFDNFGETVALFSDRVVVGAALEDSNFTSVTNGSTWTDDDSISESGAAFVFSRAGATWTHEAYLKPNNPILGNEFGSAVSIFGDSIVVGAAFEDSCQTSVSITAPGDTGCTSAGAAYLFQYDGTNWSQQGYLKAPNAGIGDNFGARAVTINGTSIGVSAVFEASNQSTITNGTSASPNNTFSSSGAVYVFDPN
jgi:hypothetical protein